MVHEFTSKHTCHIPIKLEKRGKLIVPRLILQSYYGFGLFRCWTSVDLTVAVIVYPKPERPGQVTIEQFLTANKNEESNEFDNEQAPVSNGADEFNELIPYKQGESLAKVAWKQVARGQGWYTKNYDQMINISPNWLSLDSLPNAPLEQQLRWLSFLIIALEKRDQAYGLILPNITIAPDQGIAHSHVCLKEIAMYG